MKRILVLLLASIYILPLYSQEGGYLNKLSFVSGDTIQFHISTAKSAYRLKIYKMSGTSSPLIYTSPQLTGGKQQVPSDASENGCNWNISYELAIPDNWQPGIYSVKFPVNSGNGDIIFAVKPRTPGDYSDILVLLTVNTWQAYNEFGGKSLYNFNSSNKKRAHRVSFNRPFTESGQYDFYRWTNNFITWLSENNIFVEFATNIDIDKNPGLLYNYSEVVTVGHDEYFSLDERERLQDFVDAGGRYVILSGNTCWWQVRFEDDFKTMVCYKNADIDPLTGIDDARTTVNWFDYPVYFPENILTGVSFRGGGYVNNQGFLTPDKGYGDYAAFNTHDWIYSGTGLKEGEEFGYSSKIVGYEVDGAPFTWKKGLPFVTGEDQTPTDFRILGISPAYNPDGFKNTHAVMGVYYKQNGGAVFNASTTNWAFGLKDPVISRITYNVITRFEKGNFPPVITNWSPGKIISKNINNEDVYVTGRDSIICSGDSLIFSVKAFDPFENTLHYRWLLDGKYVSSDPVFVFKNNLPSGWKYVSADVFNGIDTATISWNLYSENNHPNKYEVKGAVLYHNFAQTPLAGVSVRLVPQIPGDTLTATTDQNGSYTFPEVPDGIYSVEAQYTVKGPADCINASDALAAAKYYANIAPLDNTQKEAADVDGSGLISNSDAFMIIRYFAELVPSFKIDDWIFSAETVTVNGRNVSAPQIKAIAAGDVNSSFNGVMPKVSPSINFVSENNRHFYTDPEGQIEIPVCVNKDLKLAAVGLKFVINSSVYTITAIKNLPQSNFITNICGDTAVVAWIDAGGGTHPINISSGAAIFKIVLTKKNPSADTGIKITALTGCELLDKSGEKIDGVELNYPGISGSVPSDFSLSQNYPNPFNPETEITYNLPESGFVNLTVFSILGKQVSELVNEQQEKGSHSVYFNSYPSSSELPSGIYFYKIKFKGRAITKKMILLK